MVTFESDALSKLASKDQLELLDSIDRLRQQGINNYDISLPQIIVCGDQSSGKSSVLEAISGVSFPVKSNLCTRFPTELVLRRTPHTSANVSIVPDPSRGESESSALSGFQEKLTGFASLPDVIEKAKLAMGITTHGKAFSKDLLRVEITGPHHPHLTIVDLPGLIHSETKHQAASDVELIQEVVQSYMEQPRSIILAVVSAKNDFANQVVLKLARKADPTGSRTLGVITKPDTLTPDSESEGLYISLARNQEVEFRLGWHVLMNLDSEKGQGTLADRDAKESEFLSRRVWAELPLASLGIRKLRDRLSKVLLRQIASELPGLIEEIDGKFTACCGQLEKLGKPRATENEQRLYLFHVGQSFQGLVKSSVDASYNDAFFEDAKTKKGYHQRIRAIVQNLNDDFAYDISKMGHYREIYEAEIPFRIISSKGVTAITKNEFLDHIEELMRKTRGRELPGTFNPMIVAELFREQSRPWEDIARRHVERVWKEACNFLHLVIAHIADGSTSNALQQEVFEPAMKQLLHNLREKTTELLKPHQSGHPITYNHYFTETLQSVRRDRLGVKVGVDKILKDFFGLQDLGGVRRLSNMSYDFTDLVQRLSQDREPDMDQFAAKEALDCLNAYYKVSIPKIIHSYP
ncbi:P-loop containing nucleoside triphosphate hydrolase protein [Apodospora peruviana]|uniref:P-loop containing nucleoside triphosphate hydrolase protein n=1 Tax=Apodospora peruviana TaxID=516989 RepID=A0AAE0HT32_9PEZI|nr:P-loop containing nucleoside triphosphate hydrolase protein [Apodospora peruviana]